jgi:hypothetical protein
VPSVWGDAVDADADAAVFAVLCGLSVRLERGTVYTTSGAWRQNKSVVAPVVVGPEVP